MERAGYSLGLVKRFKNKILGSVLFLFLNPSNTSAHSKNRGKVKLFVKRRKIFAGK